MNKLEAIVEIIREAQRTENTVAHYKHMLRVLKALEFNSEDATTVLIHLDYVSPETREPYQWLSEKLK